MKSILKKDSSLWSYQESEFFLLAEQGRFEEALEVISKVPDDFDPKILLLKSQCYFRSGKPYEALQILKSLEDDGIDLPQISILKGKCFFYLKEYFSAYFNFKKGYIEGKTPEIERFMLKCQIHLSKETNNGEESIFNFSHEQNEPSDGEDAEFSINYDYYQTDTHVIILIDVSGAKSKSFAKFDDKSVDVYIDNLDINLHFPLKYSIIPSKSSINVNPYNIECRLLKRDPGEWDEFE